MTREMKEDLRIQKDLKRSKVEARVEPTTGYELIFPSEDFNYELMEEFFLKSREAYNEFNSGPGGINRVKKTSIGVDETGPNSTRPGVGQQAGSTSMTADE